MVIYHFNRIIRNRFIWAGFAVMIAFAFVSVDSCFTGTPPSQTVGKLGGKPVSLDEFSRIERSVRGFGRRQTQLTEKEIQAQTWEKIAALRTAESMGLKVTNEEVAQAITASFSGAEGFNFATYQKLLAENGLTVKGYEEVVREELLIQKLSTAVAAANWVSPMETDEELAAMTDSFTVQSIEIVNDFVAKDMKLTSEKLKAYYDANKDSFALPERISVRYVQIPLSNYMAAAKALVDQESIQEYYDSNTSKYTHSTTNGPVTKPLSEVKESIVGTLAKQEARYIAGTNLNNTVVPKMMNASFDAVAKELGLPVQETPFFSEKRLPPMRDARAIADAAFELDPTRTDSRFGVAKGEDAVYVITQLAASPAHVPDFKEAEVTVLARATAQARSDAYAAFVSNKVALIEKELAKTSNLAAAAKAAKVEVSNVSTSMTFTVVSMQNGAEIPNASLIVPAAIRLQKGQLSKPVFHQMSNNAMLVFLQDRKPGDAVSSEMYRGQIQNQIARRRSGGLFREWMKWNLKELGLTDNTRAAAAVEKSADE